MLRDVRFRQALTWAVDRQKCATLGWGEFARPGTTIIPPGQWPKGFDAHWGPAPSEAFGFDLDNARQLLDAAGYRDANGDGVREYKGKSISLRLWARSDSTASQVQGKLIAGWFKDIGLHIDFSVIDPGALSDSLYATTDGGATYAPDYDMYLWDSFGYIDPGDTLSSYVTDQIWNWNDPCWSSAEFDRQSVEQYSEMDTQKRLDLLHRMQQIMYVDTPMVVVDYPDTLEAVNTAKWDGWTRFMGGAAFYSSFNMDSYLNVRPKATPLAVTSSSTWWLALAAAAAVIAVLVWVVRRGRGRALEE